MDINFTKTDILTAVTELIEGYKKNTLKHTTQSCPLCHIYCPSNNYCSTTCLNSVFAPITKHFSCIDRTKNYYFLDWCKINNRLAEYWTDIFQMLEAEKADDIILLTDEIKAKILEIANKYQS